MIPTESIESLITRTVHKSRFAGAATIVFVITIAAATAVLTTRTRTLALLVENQQAQIRSNQQEIQRNKVAIMQTQALLSRRKRAVDVFFLATQHLLNREYSEAISGYSDFLKVFPADAAGLNALGYSEYRYARQLKSDSTTAGEAGTLLEEQSDEMLAKAETHYLASIKSDPKRFWSSYNLTLLLFQTNKVQQAIDRLQTLLADHPETARLICNDGQFRRMRKDSRTSPEFVRIVSEAVKKQAINSCWVLQ